MARDLQYRHRFLQVLLFAGFDWPQQDASRAARDVTASTRRRKSRANQPGFLFSVLMGNRGRAGGVPQVSPNLRDLGAYVPDPH